MCLVSTEGPFGSNILLFPRLPGSPDAGDRIVSVVAARQSCAILGLFGRVHITVLAGDVNACSPESSPHLPIAGSELRLHLRIAFEHVEPKLPCNVTHRVGALASRVKTSHQLGVNTQLQIVLHCSREILDPKLRVFRLAGSCLRADMVNLASHRQVNSLLIGQNHALRFLLGLGCDELRVENSTARVGSIALGTGELFNLTLQHLHAIVWCRLEIARHLPELRGGIGCAILARAVSAGDIVITGAEFSAAIGVSFDVGVD